MASERVADLKAKANAAVTKSDFSTAVAHLTEALLEMQPGAKELWSNRAFALSAMGKHAEALVDAQRCIDMAPTFSKGYLRAGRALIALGRHSDATNLDTYVRQKIKKTYGQNFLNIKTTMTTHHIKLQLACTGDIATLGFHGPDISSLTEWTPALQQVANLIVNSLLTLEKSIILRTSHKHLRICT